AYLAVVVFSTLLGAYFSDLYNCSEKTWRYYVVALSVPVAIAIAASLLASALYLASGFSQPEAVGPGGSAVDTLAAVIYIALVFIYGALPVLCIGWAIAAVILICMYGKPKGESAL